jgi:DNA mismatch endonuclease (patch repair protein)
MTDRVSIEKRSEIMRAVRSANTGPELIVRSAAHRMGLRFRLHDRTLPGKPDLVLKRWKTVVFVHGCFWHGHVGCRKTGVPKSNSEFWRAKFRANRERDARNLAELAAQGWRTIIIWQCEAKTIDSATKLLRPAFARKPRPSRPTSKPRRLDAR